MIRIARFHHTRSSSNQNVEMFLMPTLLSDTNLFLWIDLENPTDEKRVRAGKLVSIPPLVHPGLCGISPSPKVEELRQGGRQVRAVSLHGDSRVDYSRKDGAFRHERTGFFSREEFSGHLPRRSDPQRFANEERATRVPCTLHGRLTVVAYNLLDGIVDNYKPGWRNCRWRLRELEQKALQHTSPKTLNDILKVKKR